MAAPPKPAVKRGSGPDALPQGEASQVAATQQEVPLTPMPESGTPAPTPEELVAALSQQEPAQQTYAPQGAQQNFLFSPTHRPNEPLSAGSAFGAGPDLTRQAAEPDRAFLQRVASNLPGDSVELRAFAARVAQGQ